MSIARRRSSERGASSLREEDFEFALPLPLSLRAEALFSDACLLVFVALSVSLPLPLSRASPCEAWVLYFGASGCRCWVDIAVSRRSVCDDNSLYMRCRGFMDMKIAMWDT